MKSLKAISLISSLFLILIFISMQTATRGQASSDCAWSPDTLITEVDGEFSNQPDVESENNYVHVVWQDNKTIPGQPYTSRIWYRRSNDNGETWGKMKVITFKNTPGNFHDPRIAVNGKNIHVVFIDLSIAGTDMVASIFYIMSKNNGNSWSKPIRLNRFGPAYYEAWYPDISISGDYVHVIWVDDREINNKYDVYYKRSTDNGNTWDDGDDDPTNDNLDHTKKISSGEYDSIYPSISSHGDGVHISWDYSKGGWEWTEIYYAGSLDNGATWSDPIGITEEDGIGSLFSAIASFGDTVHIVWHDDRHLTQDNCNSEIYYRRSIDGGLSWEEPVRLTEMDMWSLHPEIDVLGDEVAVIWQDERDSPLECGVVGFFPLGEIYYKRSLDGGLTWDDGDSDPGNDNADHTKRLSEIDEIGGHGKSVSLETHFIHVVFDDARFGAPEPPGEVWIKDVFYKQGSCQ